MKQGNNRDTMGMYITTNYNITETTCGSSYLRSRIVRPKKYTYLKLGLKTTPHSCSTHVRAAALAVRLKEGDHIDRCFGAMR